MAESDIRMQGTDGSGSAPLLPDPTLYYAQELAEAQSMAVELARLLVPAWAELLSATDLRTADTETLYRVYAEAFGPLFEGRVPRTHEDLLAVAITNLVTSRTTADQGGQEMAAERVLTALDQMYWIADMLALPTDGRTGRQRAAAYREQTFSYHAARGPHPDVTALDTIADTDNDAAADLFDPDQSAGRAARNEAVIEIAVPAGGNQRAYGSELAERWRRVRDSEVRASEDNLQRIFDDGRSAAVDLRLVGRKRDGEGKLEAVADTVAAMHTQTPSVHLVYCDIDAPRARFDQDAPLSVHQQLRDLLIERGVPAERISLVREARVASDLYSLVSDADATQTHVLIGTTWRLGRITPDIERSVAIHHVDVPENSSTLQARELHETLNGAATVVRYVTEGSADSFAWTALQRKTRFVNQLTVDEVQALATRAAVPHWSERGSYAALTDAQLAAALLDTRSALMLARQAFAEPVGQFDEQAVTLAARETFPDQALRFGRAPFDPTAAADWSTCLDTVRQAAAEHAAASVAEEMARAGRSAEEAAGGVTAELRVRAQLSPARRATENAERAQAPRAVSPPEKNLAESGLTSSNASAAIPRAGDDRSARYGL